MAHPGDLFPANPTGRNFSVCFPNHRIWSGGIYNGGDPFTFSLPIFFLQLTVMVWLSRLLAVLLRPLRQPLVLCELIVGILLGPTVFRPCGRRWEACRRLWEGLFPHQSDLVMGTCSYIGIYYFVFVEGIKLDFSMVPRAGKKALYIGVTALVSYFLTVIIMAQFFKDYISVDIQRKKVVTLLALSLAPSIFPTLQPILAELKLLNTDTARTSMKVATVHIIPCIMLALGQQVLKHSYKSAWYGVYHLLTILAMWAILIFVFRRIAVFIVRTTPEGQQVRPGYVLHVLLAVMSVSLVTSIIAATVFELLFLMAMLVPSGPPLGSALIEKAETFARVVLLPFFFVLNGLIVDLTQIDDWTTFWVWQLILLSAWVAKLIATTFVGLYLGMPTDEAVALAFAGNLKGLIEPIVFYNWYRYQVIDAKMMSTLDCTLVLMTCISSPVTALLIERMAKKKRASLVRSVEQYMSNPNPTTTELRLLACVYNQDSVPSLLNILDISHLHKRTTPICFYLLQLVELVGSGAPILSPHQHPHRSTSHHSNFDKILTTFRKHEKHCGAAVSVQPFTSVSPFETMHQDVCSLAAEKKVSLIVIPFHKKIGMGGAEARLRLVAQKIMAEVLCSVGILVDNGQPNYFAVGWEAPDKRAYRVGILFLGGQDDREALAYVLRVADHPRADITVLRILGAYDSAADDIKRERLLDDRAVGDFRLQTLEKKKVVYREEWVKNAEDIVVAVQSMGSHFDLMVVGRRHKVHSKIMNELLDWSEYVELGVIGDMLAAPDFAKFAMAILVVQQSMGTGEVVKEKETVPGTPSATTSSSETAVAPSTRRLPEPR